MFFFYLALSHKLSFEWISSEFVSNAFPVCSLLFPCHSYPPVPLSCCSLWQLIGHVEQSGLKIDIIILTSAVPIKWAYVFTAIVVSFQINNEKNVLSNERAENSNSPIIIFHVITAVSKAFLGAVLFKCVFACFSKIQIQIERHCSLFFPLFGMRVPNLDHSIMQKSIAKYLEGSMRGQGFFLSKIS